MNRKLLNDIRADMLTIGATINTLREEMKRSRGSNRSRIQDEINTLQPAQREIQRAYIAAKRALVD